MKGLTVLFPLLLFISLVPQDAVRACSGGGYSIEDYAEAPVIVKAEVVDMDDGRQRYIIRVDTYLKGAGPEYLLVTPYWYDSTPLRLLHGVLLGDECDFLYKDRFIGIFPPLRGETGYFFLQHENTGAYHIFGTSIFTFPQSMSTVEILRRDSDPPYQSEYLNQDAFVALIADLTDSTPSAPIPDVPYPTTAPLVITTERGTRYFRPIDHGEPIEIIPNEPIDPHNWESYALRLLYSGLPDVLERMAIRSGCPLLDCVTFSRHGFHAAFFDSDHKLVVVQNIPVIGIGAELDNAHAFLFSPLEDVIAIGTNDAIELHYLVNYRLSTEYHAAFDMLGQIRFDAGANGQFAWLAEHAAWSPDGRFLAYSDANGLWLWDVLSDGSEPELLLPVTEESVPYARYFSPMGGYLAITTGEVRETLELRSGTRYPDGIMSPDDRLLLAYDTSSELFSLSLCILGETSAPCRNIDDNVRQVTWLDSYRFLEAYCWEAEHCSVKEWPVITYLGGQTISDGSSFDYDASSGNIVVLKDAHTISINGADYDLSHYLDGDIVSVEWLPSYFYRAE